MLARMYGARTLLGTATPALETYYNVRMGKYGLVELTERFGQVRLPEVEVVDIKELQRKRRMVGPFSPRLLEEMRRAWKQGTGHIVPEPARLRSDDRMPHVRWVPKCKNCDVSLTYHKGLNQMTCHYCGYTCNVPVRCPACEGTELVQRGLGTEKVEDAVRQVFPEPPWPGWTWIRPVRRSSYEGILEDFQSGKTDVLVGTQMVTRIGFERSA